MQMLYQWYSIRAIEHAELHLIQGSGVRLNLDEIRLVERAQPGS